MPLIVNLIFRRHLLSFQWWNPVPVVKGTTYVWWKYGLVTYCCILKFKIGFGFSPLECRNIDYMWMLHQLYVRSEWFGGKMASLSFGAKRIQMSSASSRKYQLLFALFCRFWGHWLIIFYQILIFNSHALHFQSYELHHITLCYLILDFPVLLQVLIYREVWRACQ